MGFHHILSKDHPVGHKWIALGVLQKAMGDWRSGTGARSFEPEVRMISNFSKIYQKPRLRWWSRWIQKLGIL